VAMDVADVMRFNNYLAKLEESADVSISGYDDYLEALKKT